MCAGAVYWREDREKRKTYRGLIDEKRAREKKEAWIRELEIREAEDERERVRRRERRRRAGLSEVDLEAEDARTMAVEGARDVAQGSVVNGSNLNSSPLETARLAGLVGGKGILGQAMGLWWSSKD